MHKMTDIAKSAKLVAVGNSVGLVIPRAMLARLRLERGDQVYLCETPDGFRLTATDPDFARKMQAADEIMHEDRDILSVLAK